MLVANGKEAVAARSRTPRHWAGMLVANGEEAGVGRWTPRPLARRAFLAQEARAAARLQVLQMLQVLQALQVLQVLQVLRLHAPLKEQWVSWRASQKLLLAGAKGAAWLVVGADSVWMVVRAEAWVAMTHSAWVLVRAEAWAVLLSAWVVDLRGLAESEGFLGRLAVAEVLELWRDLACGQ